MNNCHNCAYKSNIPGDTHISCRFNWAKSNEKPPEGNLHGIRKGWYNFPMNYDPTWMIDECKKFSSTIDKEMYLDSFDFLSALLSFIK